MYCIYVPTTHVIMSEKCFLKQEFYKLYVILLLALLARIFEVGFFTAANKKGWISKDFKQGQTFGKRVSFPVRELLVCMWYSTKRPLTAHVTRLWSVEKMILWFHSPSQGVIMTSHCCLQMISPCVIQPQVSMSLSLSRMQHK